VLALGDETRLPPLPAAPAAFVGRVVPTATVVGSADRVIVRPLADLPRRDVVAVAGVARPERFWNVLARLGVAPSERLRFPDHHPYTPADAARIRDAAGSRAIVTTEKDLVKLARLDHELARRLHALRVDVEVEQGEALVDRLLAPPEVALRPD
jgi:tetraacyldisaccharide 4'-kinase